jgi:hypothetical protein
MTMSLVGPYLTTTRYGGKKKRKLPNTAALREATAKHDAWLRKQGLHPEQRDLKRAFTGKFKYDMPDYSIEDTVPLSNNLKVDGGRKTGIMANLHKEKPEVQKEILDKASRCMPLFNKGGIQYATPDTDMTTVGSKSRRG